MTKQLIIEKNIITPELAYVLGAIKGEFLRLIGGLK